jgi:hypothetical protein
VTLFKLYLSGAVHLIKGAPLGAFTAGKYTRDCRRIILKLVKVEDLHAQNKESLAQLRVEVRIKALSASEDTIIV